eukprot:1490227-Lingulodinium_polyedra.AAC.1
MMGAAWRLPLRHHRILQIPSDIERHKRPKQRLLVSTIAHDQTDVSATVARRWAQALTQGYVVRQ